MSRKLVVFDCDGVLTDHESSWQVLHEYFGSKPGKYFAELYKRGLISYLDWMKIDIALMIYSWGRPILKSEVLNALSKIRVKPEAKRVVEELKSRNHRVVVVSSGVDLLVRRVCEELKIDYCLYNELLFVNDELIPGGISKVPLRDKSRIIKTIAETSKIGLENTVYVGDSEWDIPVFKTVPVSIAVEPCGTACKYAKYVVKNLEEILKIPELS
ncbi:MAG: HAD-IB family phosphatase [Desulfurococcaceae archaeon]